MVCHPERRPPPIFCLTFPNSNATVIGEEFLRPRGANCPWSVARCPWFVDRGTLFGVRRDQPWNSGNELRSTSHEPPPRALGNRQLTTDDGQLTLGLAVATLPPVRPGGAAKKPECLSGSMVCRFAPQKREMGSSKPECAVFCATCRFVPLQPRPHAGAAGLTRGAGDGNLQWAIGIRQSAIPACAGINRGSALSAV